MSRESRMLAGILLAVLPTVVYGGLTLLGLLSRNLPGYSDNQLRHDLWRAGHAHAGVYLVLSLVMLRYVDEAVLSPFWRWIARTGAPIAAILIPAAFFLSVVSPAATAQRLDQSRFRRRPVSRRRPSDPRSRSHSRRTDHA
jgi:drug/metabolite transporter superfamily protein YnfA